MESDPAPLVVAIAGPNGAGKSSIAPRVLRRPLEVEEFVNADVIARGLSAFHSEKVAIAADVLMMRRLHELVGEWVTFAFETTLSNRGFAPKISRWKVLGYRFALVYVWVPVPEVSVARVATRVEEGGHHVPEETICRRYDRSLRNLFELYIPLADWWQVIDNTDVGQMRVVARGTPDRTEVYRHETWAFLESTYGGDQDE